MPVFFINIIYTHRFLKQIKNKLRKWAESKDVIDIMYPIEILNIGYESWFSFSSTTDIVYPKHVPQSSEKNHQNLYVFENFVDTTCIKYLSRIYERF